ncbi:chorismate lyase [Alteromonadaceae bacterium Bs31]|nr:chorismate lyase [Alteromonadaceae bacterium Bs31]
MTRLFTSTGYLEADDQSTSLDLTALPPFLRVLLTTDGTVTKSIESFFWEPVKVVNCGQRYDELEVDAPVIRRNKGDRVLRRSVQLVGANSATCYASAVSLVYTELLPAELRARLESGSVGIGELLRECGLETYREIVAVGEGVAEESLNTSRAIWRTYRIVMEHCPFIQITEYFPLAVYESSSKALNQ